MSAITNRPGSIMATCYHPHDVIERFAHSLQDADYYFPITDHASLFDGVGGHVVTATDGSIWRVGPLRHDGAFSHGAALLREAPGA